MKRLLVSLAAVGLLAVTVAAPAYAAPATGVTATPAKTVTWAGTYTAQFVRSASGIINETNRVNSAGAQNGWASADVYLQFRPSPGTPANPACDPNGLVTPVFTYVNYDPAIAGTPTSGYFLPGVSYNVCVYLVNPVVATGTIDSSASAGATATLPLSGHFRINVSGTYANDGINVADAEYVSLDGWATYQQGYDVSPYFLGEGFGDVQVNGNFVDWGAYNAGHAYSLVGSYSSPINLAVFDGDSNSNTKVPSWYGDNVGSLSYTITYLGL